MNGFISINKPQNMTSFDVVRNVKRIFKTKAGHCGTLDPNAEGVLVVAVGQATKALQFMQLDTKVYEAGLKLGLKTDTGDVWGETLEKKEIPSFNKDDVHRIFEGLIGKQSQRVPMVSAKKIDGKKLYEYHRQNIEIETQYTDIEIFSLELLNYDTESIQFRALVSTGTYIRTLCEDISEQLGTVGTMSSLIRSQVGEFTIASSIKLEDVNENVELMSVKEAIPLPKLVDATLEFDVKNGKRIELDTKHDTLMIDTGIYYAVYTREVGNTFKSVRGLW